MRIWGYRIRYETRNHNGMGGGTGDGIYEWVVRNGVVAECTFSDAPRAGDGPCDTRGVAGVVSELPLPVDLLFSRVNGFMARQTLYGDPGTDGVAWTSVRFDEAWNYPTFIHFDSPKSVDEEFTITVQLFEVLDADLREQPPNP